LGEGEDSLAAFIHQLEERWPDSSRCPVIYAPAGSVPGVREILHQSGYDQFDEEAWMLHSLSDVPARPASDALSIVRALNENQTADFVRVFEAGFQIR